MLLWVMDVGGGGLGCLCRLRPVIGMLVLHLADCTLQVYPGVGCLDHLFQHLVSLTYHSLHSLECHHALLPIGRLLWLFFISGGMQLF